MCIRDSYRIGVCRYVLPFAMGRPVGEIYRRDGQQRHDAADGFDSDGDSSGMFCQRGASHPDGNPAWKLEGV